MANSSTNEYLQLLNELETYHIPKVILDSLSGYLKSIYQYEIENRFSAPMLWIGLYIGFASLVCMLLMLGDLVRGLRSRKQWFPCNYFRINAFSLTVISVAMKLPVDLTGMMPGVVDELAKNGSLAFMCTIMANLLPSLATMDDNDLYSNIATLSVLVITMIVNVSIQIKTGVVSASTYYKDPHITTLVSPKHNVTSLPKFYTILPIIYVTLLLVLLILYVCSCLALLTYKKRLESDYQYKHHRSSMAIQSPPERIPTVTELQDYVKRHWIRARSGSSQYLFVGSFQTTSATGVICVFVTILHILTMFWTFDAIKAKDYDSDYSWSMIVIVILQFTGVVIGTIAPLCRCFAAIIRFEILPHYLNISFVESFWTKKLYDWRAASIGLLFQKLDVAIQALKRVIVSFCISFQVVVVVLCKIIAWNLYKISFLLKNVFSSSDDLGERTDDSLNERDIRYFVNDYRVKLGSELSVPTTACLGFLRSLTQWIQNGEKNQPCIDLLEKCTPGFPGVARLNVYNDDRSPGNCWSLQVVTLATIACSLPEIEKKQVDWLLTNVSECLPYVMLVDESLNNNLHGIQKAVKVMWEEVVVDHKWIGNKLPDSASSQLNTARDVVRWFYTTADHIRSNTPTITSKVIHKNDKRTFAYSMVGTTENIFHHPNDDMLAGQEKLFEALSLCTADTIAACFTNLPQVIQSKCHPSVVEEREASVKESALLLGEIKQIMETLQQHGIPGINRSKRPFLSSWRVYVLSISPNP